MSTPFDVAKSHGYSDAEIKDFMDKKSAQGASTELNPAPIGKPVKTEQEKYDAALKAGYSKKEIDKYLYSKKSAFEKFATTSHDLTIGAARLPIQYSIGALQKTPAAIAWDVGAAHLGNEDAALIEYRKNVFEDIERLAELKQTGVWDEQDQNLMDSLLEQVRQPKQGEEFGEKARPFVKTVDLTTSGLAEKAGLAPEGALEKGARWAGFIRNPKNVKELGQIGLKPKDVLNFFKPTANEAARGLGAGVALQIAESGGFGPIGTLASAIIGDLVGGGSLGALKGVGNVLRNPKQAIARGVARFGTKNAKLQTQAELIRKAQEAGITLDAGTITDSKILKWVQSALAASGLTGKALDDLRNQLTTDVINSYKSVAEGVGQVKFNSLHDAGEAFIETAKKFRTQSRAANTANYKAFEDALTKADVTNPTPILAEIQKVKEQLKPGSFKSGPQKRVLDILDKVSKDFVDAEGMAKPVQIKVLSNLKRAVQEEIDFDTVGGLDKVAPIFKQMNNTLIGYGANNPRLSGLLSKANAGHAKTVKTFQEGTVGKFLKKGQAPDKILNTMSSVKGIRDVKNALMGSPEGKELWDSLRRAKLEEVIGDNMIDSTTQQLKTGTFSKILEKGKNAEVIRELVGPEAFAKIENLQHVAGRLAESSQKFLNASQSGTKSGDLLLAAEILRNAWGIFTGNPYPLARTATLVGGGYATSKLLADKKFLSLLQEAVLERSNDPKVLDSFAKKLADYVKENAKKIKVDQDTAGAAASASLRG